jgi:hypothetical protein
MKRYLLIGIAVISIAGIAITMALVNNTALAENNPDEAGEIGTLIEEVENTDTAVTQDPVDDVIGQNFVDEDGDGVCDTCGNEPGTNRDRPYGNSRGSNNFIDEDGDGLCDSCGLAPGDGTGNQYGNGASNFVDGDGDGVCDTCGTAPQDGTGNQYGRQGGRGGNGRQGRGQGGNGQGFNAAVQP